MCKVSKMVNDIFNAQILIHTITTLLHCTICVYSLYMNFHRQSNFVIDQLDLTLIYMLDSVVGTLKIALMSYDCEYTMGQVKNIYLILQLCSISHFSPNHIFLNYE